MHSRKTATAAKEIHRKKNLGFFKVNIIYFLLTKNMNYQKFKTIKIVCY